MRDRIYRAALFSPYQREAMAGYLEKMAARGWLLDKAGNSFWRFRRAEPKKLRVEVVFFPDASAFDPGPTPELLNLEEYCAKDGWTVLARWGPAQIFVNEREDPTPIETDPVIQVKILRRAVRRTVLPAWLLLLALSLFQLWMKVAWLRRDLISTLADPADLWMFPFWILLLAVQLYEVGSYLWWLHRARRAAEDGIFLSAGSTRWASWLILGAAVLLILRASLGSRFMVRYLVLWTICYCVIVLLVNRLRDGMKEKGFPRWLNRSVSIGAIILLTIGFLAGLTVLIVRFGWGRQEAPERYEYQGFTFDVWHDSLPLTVEDLNGPSAAKYSTRAQREESFLLAQTWYRQDRLLMENRPDPPPGELDYTVVEVKAPFLYGPCRRTLLEDAPFDEEYRPIDPIPWGAEEAYQLYWSGEPMERYLLCYPQRLVTIRFNNIELTPERMETVGEKLGG